MCKVIGLLSLLFSLSGIPVLALEQKIGSLLETTTSSTSLEGSGLAQKQVSGSGQTITYRAEDIFSLITLDAAIGNQYRDYSQYVLTDEFGHTQKLSDVAPARGQVAASVAADFSFKNSTVKFQLSSDLTDSPFYSQSMGVGYERGFFENSTKAGVFLSAKRAQQPKNYYLNVDLSRKARPTTVETYDLTAHVEQIMTRSWKARIETSVGQRIQERPSYLGLKIKNAVALTGRIFSQLNGGFFSENRNQPLLNERGYFRLGFGEAIISVEPLYDLLVSLGYTYQVELEDNSFNNSATQVGSDQFHFGLNYTWSTYEVFFKGSYAVTNTNINESNLMGGFQWSL